MQEIAFARRGKIMTAWEAITILPAAIAVCVITIGLVLGAILLFNSPRIVPALQRNWREDKKLHFWETVTESLLGS